MVTYDNVKVEPFNQEAFDHIMASGMDPAFLAKLYGITHELVNWIQMGRISFVDACRSKALTDHLGQGNS